MLVGCSGVGQYSDWLLYSTASIYNVVDRIVISDGSPFGHFQERYIEDLERLDIENKITFIEEDWKYPRHPHAEDLGLPIDDDNYSSGRIMKSATDEARKLGATRLLWFSSDHVFDESVRCATKLTVHDSYRCHYYNMVGFNKAGFCWTDEYYSKKLGDPDFQSCIFLLPGNGWFHGLEGMPQGVTEQYTVRFVWFCHYVSFSPCGWSRTVEMLRERGKYRAHIYNRSGMFNRLLSEEEEECWVKDYVDKYVRLKDSGSRDVGERFGLPRAARVVKDPYKYVEEGWPGKSEKSDVNYGEEERRKVEEKLEELGYF